MFTSQHCSQLPIISMLCTFSLVWRALSLVSSMSNNSKLRKYISTGIHSFSQVQANVPQCGYKNILTLSHVQYKLHIHSHKYENKQMYHSVGTGTYSLLVLYSINSTSQVWVQADAIVIVWAFILNNYRLPSEPRWKGWIRVGSKFLTKQFKSSYFIDQK